MATDRQKRQRRRARAEARRAAQEVPATPSPKTTERPVRNDPERAQSVTYRVANAQRQIAKELPSIIYPKGEGRTAVKPLHPDRKIIDAPPPPKPPKLPRSPARQREADRADALLMREEEKAKLKCRPKDSRPKGGAGSGRSFIPWGDC